MEAMEKNESYAAGHRAGTRELCRRQAGGEPQIEIFDLPNGMNEVDWCKGYNDACESS
jgi:hypothetical protein